MSQSQFDRAEEEAQRPPDDVGNLVECPKCLANGEHLDETDALELVMVTCSKCNGTGECFEEDL